MQFRNESIAAANKAVEQVVAINFATGFTTTPVAQTITYDINNDGTPDYSVAVATPTCIQSTQVAGIIAAGQGSSAGLDGFADASSYSTLWDMTATVTDVSGASVTVSQGVRVELNSLQKSSVCP
jgi:hypothetical protein